MLSSRLIVSLVAFAAIPAAAAELTSVSDSAISISYGPEFSKEIPDFEITKGVLNELYYIYRNDYTKSTDCVLKVNLPTFGTKFTDRLTVVPRINLKAVWNGSQEDFLKKSAFILRLSYLELGPDGVPLLRKSVDQRLKISSFSGSIDGGLFTATTDSRWVWQPFNPITINGPLEGGTLEICDISDNQNLFVSVIDVNLSHTQKEEDDL